MSAQQHDPGLVVGLLVVFVAVQVTQREWSWVAVGTILLVLNLILWRRHRAIAPSRAAVT